MSQKTAVPPDKKNAAHPARGLLQHAAVCSVPERSMPSTARTSSNFGHDFSQVTTRTAPSLNGTQRAASCALSPRTCPFGGACHTCPVTVQAKLQVNQPGDKYEREADRVADQVMRMPGSRLQRQEVEPEDEEEEEEPIQAKQVAGRMSGHVPGPTTGVGLVQGQGHPLPRSVRDLFEPRFGRDFGQVRVHTDVRAAASAQMLGARAYTVGRDIVFGSGCYAPSSHQGRSLLAHELTHVVQQRARSGTQQSCLRAGLESDVGKRHGDDNAKHLADHPLGETITVLDQPVVQCDLARLPRGTPAPVTTLTPEEVQDAIAYNRNRFSDPYSIRVIRDVLGLAPVPAMVDEALVTAVVQWQAERRMKQDGKVGHRTTRSIYLELVAEGEYKDAITLLMDSYNLPGSLRLYDVRVGTGPNCCGAANGADAVTYGGRHCPPVGGPIRICFCRPQIPRNVAGYNHFVRIVGHELIHVPQCAVGTGNADVDEFEAYYWEACARGRAPNLTPAERVNHANTALGHFALIRRRLRTPARNAMRNRLNNLVAAGGSGRCG